MTSPFFLIFLLIFFCEISSIDSNLRNIASALEDLNENLSNKNQSTHESQETHME